MPREPSPELIALRSEVWRELCDGQDIYEAYLEDSEGRLRVYGMTESGHDIYINPAPHILDCLLHEILHRLHPKWGERRVLLTASRMLATMDDAEVRKWHRKYEKVVRRTNGVKVD
jgi:hypothetical protein